MIRGENLQELARLRLDEAEALFSAGLYDGSYYLCGYVVELALKACVCRNLRVPEYPETERVFKTHDFDLLALLAGLRFRVEEQRSLSTTFADYWSVVTGWQLEDRYAIGKTRADALAMLEALRSNPEGVLTWLSQLW